MDGSKVASGFAHLLVSQVSVRLVSFSLNLLTARFLSPEDYGLSSIQFHLLITTIMMLSREGFRRGCMRLKPAAGQTQVASDRVWRVARLVIPVTAVVAAAVCGVVLYSHHHSLAKGGEDIPSYSTAVIIIGLSCIIEALSEPFYIEAAVNMRYRIRTIMDSTPLVVKSLVTLALLAMPQLRRLRLAPALIFAAAQVAFAATTLAGYYIAHRASGAGASGRGARRGAAKAQPPAGGDAGDRDVCSAVVAFSVQSAEKLVLAEGSKLVLAGLASSYDQGVIGLVNNLGSLVVRTLFQPLEEVAFAAFSRQRVSAEGSKTDSRGQALTLLTTLVRLVTLLGGLAVVFGPPNARLAIQLVYGQRWAASAAPAVLSVYCWYILLLAVNGVTEAFVHAVLDSKGLVWSNAALVVLTVIHTGLCWLAITHRGSEGVVGADAVNMGLRILFSLWCIARYFKGYQGFRLSVLAPQLSTTVVLGVAYVTLRIALGNSLGLGQDTDRNSTDLTKPIPMRQAAQQVAVSAVLLIVTLAGVAKCERGMLTSARGLWRARRDQPGKSDDKKEQ